MPHADAGAVYGCGSVADGQLGFKLECSCCEPSLLEDFQLEETVLAVAAGKRHSIILVETPHLGWRCLACGNNTFGQCGEHESGSSDEPWEEKEDVQTTVMQCVWEGRDPDALPSVGIAAGPHQSFVWNR